MHVLEIKDLSKEIKSVNVLYHINLQMEAGHVYGLVGDNGSGKTMLMRAICGLIRPTSGTILFDGKERAEADPVIGVMIENTSLFPDLTGMENLTMLAGIRHIISKKDIQDAISRVGLDPDDSRTFRKYSLGMKQRLILAQSIMEKPDILLLDEPTNAIDQDGVRKIRQIMLEEAARGAIILLASHISVDISSLCDRVFTIEHGRING